jgi:glucose/arabinose dehydrogenase
MRPILLAAALVATPALAQQNYGATPASGAKPFVETAVATFNNPWALAFLPDTRMLVTERTGKLWLAGPGAIKVRVTGVPAVHSTGQGGLLFVAIAPTYARDHQIYFTFSEPGAGGDGLALARATLAIGTGTAKLQNVKVLWRELPRGKGEQFGAYLAFAPDGKSLFLTAGERQRFTPAQDPNQGTGKILHLTLDGQPAPGNPLAGKTGATTVELTDPPADTVAAKTAPVRKVSVPAPNLIPAEIWTSGHRNQYGLAFDAAGRLWETEMGPKGGDELNLIQPGRNYGWPLVSYGENYDGKPIPNPNTRPDLAKPVLYWNPVIAPAGFTFYYGKLFPQWRGNAFVGGLAGQCIVRIVFNGTQAAQANRWDMDNRIRFVTAGPDGALWVLEDGDGGRLLRLTPKR